MSVTIGELKKFISDYEKTHRPIPDDTVIELERIDQTFYEKVWRFNVNDTTNIILRSNTKPGVETENDGS